jgi:hypothetical protein
MTSARRRGLVAASKQRGNGSRSLMTRRRIAWASGIVLSWKQCSRPLTPCELLVDPTAMINLSSVRNQCLFFVLGDSRSGRALTGDITPHRSLSLVARHLYLHQAFGHIQVHRRAHEEMPPHAGDELSQGFDERPHLDGPDASRREEWGECKVGLRRDESDVVCCWREGLDQSDSLGKS